jgi:hypothetical protein
MEGLYTFKQFVEEQNLFSEASIRNMIFKRNENGLEESGAIKRYGRKILIDKEKFYFWIKNLPVNDYSLK